MMFLIVTTQAPDLQRVDINHNLFAIDIWNIEFYLIFLTLLCILIMLYYRIYSTLFHILLNRAVAIIFLSLV